MSLQLNNTIVPFLEFYGPNNEQMPLLIAQGRMPLSAAGLMQQRLEVLAEEVSDEVKSAWWDNYFFTDDLAAYDSGDNFKVVLDSEIARALNNETPLYQSAIQFGKTPEEATSFYQKLQGREFSRKNLEGKLNRVLTREEVKAHPVWQELAKGNQSLLNDYTDAVFDQLEQKYQRTTAMGVWLPDTPKLASGRLWVVGGLYNDSVAGGGNGVDKYNGRLVGVAPEAQYAKNGQVPNANAIATSVNNYLATRTIAEGITKQGVLKAVQAAYK